MPLASIKNQSPYFLLYDEIPNLNHIRTFGCLCFINTPKVHRTKFDHRAIPGVFLGYVVHTKGYKVLDIATNNIIVSRDVNFFEKHFLF